MVYTKIIEDSPVADRSEVRRGLDSLLARTAKPPKSTNGNGRRRGPGVMTPEQARRIAEDMAEYDTKMTRRG